jgi:multiple sugar transport system permease protein
MKRRTVLFRMICYVVVVAGAISFLFPFMWMVSTSLKTDQDVFTWPPRLMPKPLRLQNYVDAWNAAPFARFFFNSAFIAVAVTLANLFFSSLAGYAFAKYRFPGKNWIFIALLATMMIPFQVTMIPVFVILSKLHWVDTYWGLIVPFTGSAFGIFLMRQFLTTIPDDLIDAARIDGCSEFRTYLTIVLPLSKPALSALGIFIFMASWNGFIWPFIIVKSTEMKTLPLAVADLAAGLYVMSWPLMMAGACFVVLPAIIVFLLFQRNFVEGITLTGLKT